MTSHERAESLFKKAESLGLDTPTQDMIAAAIQAAECDASQSSPTDTEMLDWLEAMPITRWKMVVDTMQPLDNVDCVRPALAAAMKGAK